ncbi:MAG: AAA family ATPase [Lachnospiraceae bacterium]|nr:AAA family ATPase [Lachnospiraceae bacterium]
MKDEFIAWMKSGAAGKVYKDSTISRYVRALEKLCFQIADLDIESTNLFYYKDILSFKKVDEQIRSNSDFERVNRASNNGNGDLSAGMSKYMDFLSSRDKTIISVNVKSGDRRGMVTDKEIINSIKKYIAAKGFTFDDGLIENYYLSLKSKPFVILAGTSGTGKTRLVRLFAEAIGATAQNGRYKLVPVRPDWSDSSDLFGHVDLNGKFISGAIIDFVKRAELDENKSPYFLCLDEMNLARVEYYLSDILSVIETRELIDGKVTTDPLITEIYYGSDKQAAGKYGTVRIPENLYIIGTVNMDETTFPFSKKVLDRANTIEFSTVDLTSDAKAGEMVKTVQTDNSFMKAKYVFFNQCSDHEELVVRVCAKLQQLNRILEKANAHVGYRVRDEIVFYMINNADSDLLKEDDAFDNEIMQKILPRIQGSSASVKNMLCDIFKYCAGDYESYQTENDDVGSKMLKAAQKEGCKYRKSAEKIAYMVRRYEEDGFTAYWL